MTQITPQPENLAKLVVLVRGEKVLLDADLANLYDVQTKVLNQAVKRNLDRFPRRLYVPTHPRRMGRYEVTNCDFIPWKQRDAVTNCDRISAQHWSFALRLH